jgi:hypothetical protein
MWVPPASFGSDFDLYGHVNPRSGLGVNQRSYENQPVLSYFLTTEGERDPAVATNHKI